MNQSSRGLSVVLAVAALCWPAPASATTIDPLLFEQLVLGADFVGIVECEQAGGIVAGYRVIESWKGPAVGSRISIRVAVNYWGQQFPIALCGERYFVTGFKEAPATIITSASGGGVPLWWRKIPSDYRLPLSQGLSQLSHGEEKGPKFEKTRKSAKALLALKPAEQELALLKAVADKYLFGDRWIGGETDKTKVKDLRARLAKLTTADSFADDLIRLASEDQKKWAVRGRIVFESAGRFATLARLEKLPDDRLPWEKRDFDELTATIRLRLRGPAAAEGPKEAPPEKPPVEADLARWRKTLAEGPEADEFGKAFEILTRYDPGPVAAYLVSWKNPKKDWRDANAGYVLGSYFAWRCSKDRTKHLTALLSASDPYIRVAGAVYLCFEDAATGAAQLKKMTTLEGDPGVWAALTLARRGHKDAVPRALEVFRELSPNEKEEQFGIVGHSRGNLQKRVLVLLSNSARAGGAPQPVLPEKEGEQLDYLTNWWKQHGDKTRLHDPWLKELEKQKVD